VVLNTDFQATIAAAVGGMPFELALPGSLLYEKIGQGRVLHLEHKCEVGGGKKDFTYLGQKYHSVCITVKRNILGHIDRTAGAAGGDIFRVSASVVGTQGRQKRKASAQQGDPAMFHKWNLQVHSFCASNCAATTWCVLDQGSSSGAGCGAYILLMLFCVSRWQEASHTGSLSSMKTQLLLNSSFQNKVCTAVCVCVCARECYFMRVL